MIIEQLPNYWKLHQGVVKHRVRPEGARRISGAHSTCC
nr:MAG TPA: hypothetical protein [Caudoviricetes sp.]